MPVVTGCLDRGQAKFFSIFVNRLVVRTSIPMQHAMRCAGGMNTVNAERIRIMTSRRPSIKRDNGCLGGFAYEQANTLVHRLRL